MWALVGSRQGRLQAHVRAHARKQIFARADLRGCVAHGTCTQIHAGALMHAHARAHGHACIQGRAFMDACRHRGEGLMSLQIGSKPAVARMSAPAGTED
eukprot:3162279-Pleurochrysis_carterae.AAC.1